MIDSDLEACLAVHFAGESLDGPFIHMSPQEFRHWWEFPRAGRDTSWVAELDGRIVGFVFNSFRGRFEGRLRFGIFLDVHPEHRRHGIGSHLFQLARDAALALGARHLDSWTYSTSRSGIPFAHQRGLTRRALLWNFRMAPAAHTPGPLTHPARVRCYRGSEDFEALLHATNATFADHFEFDPWDDAMARSSFLENDAFRPELTLLAEVDGHPAGFCRCEMNEDGEGWVEMIGVEPRARGTGLGRFLLDEGIRRLCAAGATQIVLMVIGHNEKAVRLYQSAGFTQFCEMQLLREDLPT